jgi:hypothetical protein
MGKRKYPEHPHPDDLDYEIGKWKPPLHSRWAKGTSGNPSGRRKRARSLSPEFGEILYKEFSKVVTASVNGEPTRISQMDLAAKTVVNRALRGDTKALAFLMQAAKAIKALPIAVTGLELEEVHPDRALLDRLDQLAIEIKPEDRKKLLNK